MSGSNRGMVLAEQDLRLIGPGSVKVPLTAALSYSRQDPYAIGMSFDVGTDEPVNWMFSRELLAAALHAPEGLGSVKAWPSASEGGEKILNLVLGPPGGYARFEVSAAGIETFLDRTFELVPAGQESAHLNLEAELAEFLSQA
jgi:hypothetical protein